MRISAAGYDHRRDGGLAVNPEEIKAKLHSDDPDVLERCRSVITEMSAAEALRGDMAESRAATTLGAISVVTGLAVAAAGAFANAAGTAGWLFLVGYGSVLAFLVRGAYFCMRTIRSQKYFVVTPNVIFDLQACSLCEVLRTEIAYKMWKYEQDVKPNSAKLFWLGRGQRSLLASIALLSLAALLAQLHCRRQLWCPDWAVWLIGIGLTVMLFALDPLVERAGGWRVGRHYKVNV